MTKILCFGDSNTWGTSPNDASRYEKNQRWPGILQGLLGASYTIIEAGQPNRTLVNNAPFDGDKSGISYLKPCLAHHHPDSIIILLGTNDLKARFNISAEQIAQGLTQLVQQIIDTTTDGHINSSNVLILSPPIINEVARYQQIYQGGAEKSQQLAEHYLRCARQLKCRYLDTNNIITSCPQEGIHWPIEQHQRLAKALLTEITSW